MTEQWFFLSNVFRLLADRSLQQFHKYCSTQMPHFNHSADDLFSLAMYNKLLPYYEEFDQAYNNTFFNKSLRKGNTLRLYQLLKEMRSQKLHIWDIKIQSVFISSTPDYIKIFPQGLSPLSLLPIEQRIMYLGNAIDMLSNYTQLNTVRDEMKAFYDLLAEARSIQVRRDANLRESRNEVMKKAYLLSNELYGVLGEFMTKYKDNPNRIEAYFPVNLLRKKKSHTKQSIEIHQITINENEAREAGLSFGPYNKFKVKNTGTITLSLYFLPDKDAAKPTKVILLQAGKSKTISIKTHASLKDRFFMIANLSDRQKGEVEIGMV